MNWRLAQRRSYWSCRPLCKVEQLIVDIPLSGKFAVTGDSVSAKAMRARALVLVLCEQSSSKCGPAKGFRQSGLSRLYVLSPRKDTSTVFALALACTLGGTRAGSITCKQSVL